MPQSGFFSRLESCRWPDETVRDFMRRAKTSRNDYYRFKKGRAPDTDTIARLARNLDVNPSWLAFGESPRERGGNDSGQFRIDIENHYNRQDKE